MNTLVEQPRMPYGARRDRARARLGDLGAASLLVSDLINVRYLSGFTGSNAALLITVDGTDTLLTDGRYRDQAALEAPDVDVRITRALLTDALAIAPTGAVAIETHTVTVDQHEALRATGVELMSAGRLVERLRAVKDEAEIVTLREACALSIEALRDILAGPLVGLTERQVRTRLERCMIDLGAEAVAFDTIVASGPNSAIPHHQPTDRELGPGDLLKIDFGARVQGYHADCTRTVVLGSAEDWQREIHAAVLEAQSLGVERLTAGRPTAEVDAQVRDTLDRAGWLEAFTTGLGHGVGLQIHEDPFFGPNSTATLSPGTVVTMEPGIYLPGRGGVRIEDTVLVTSDGPDVLTPTPTELLEIA